jgi:hypothetical protein
MIPSTTLDLNVRLNSSKQHFKDKTHRNSPVMIGHRMSTPANPNVNSIFIYYCSQQVENLHEKLYYALRIAKHSRA